MHVYACTDQKYDHTYVHALQYLPQCTVEQEIFARLKFRIFCDLIQFVKVYSLNH